MTIPFRIRHAEWIAGLLVILAGTAVLVALLVLTRAQGAFETKPGYFVTIEDGHGLTPGGPVKMLGIVIGSVEHVEITAEARVRVHLEIRPEYADRIREDSHAQIEVSLGLEGMLAGVGLDITPGSASAAAIEPGGDIPAREPKSFADLLPGISDDPMFEDMEAVLENARVLSDQLADAQSELSAAMSSAAIVLARLERGEGTVGRLLTDDGKLYDRVVATMDKVDGTLEDTSKMMGRSGKLMTKSEDLIGRVDGLLDSSDEMIGSATKVFDKMDPVMDEADQAMKNLDKAVVSFAKTTEKLGDLLVKMDKLVADMAQVTAATKKVWPIRRHIKER